MTTLPPAGTSRVDGRSDGALQGAESTHDAVRTWHSARRSIVHCSNKRSDSARLRRLVGDHNCSPQCTERCINDGRRVHKSYRSERPLSSRRGRGRRGRGRRGRGGSGAHSGVRAHDARRGNQRRRAAGVAHDAALWRSEASGRSQKRTFSQHTVSPGRGRRTADPRSD